MKTISHLVFSIVNVCNNSQIQNLISKKQLPRFLDVHPMKGVTEDNLKQIQMSPKDEFGVTHVNILFNPEADRLFCILDALDKDAVEKNHQKLGIKCEWIMEVKETADGGAK